MMMSKCTKCSMHECTFSQVSSIGNTEDGCELLIIGDYPKAEDDASGRPLTGSQYSFLWELLAVIGVKYRVTYALKCIPIDTATRRYRKPVITEYTHCIRENLVAEIEYYKPKCILALGQATLEALLGEGVKIGDYRERASKQLVGTYETRLLATYHPNYVVNNDNQMFYDRFIGDVVYACRHAMRERHVGKFKTVTVDATQFSRIVDIWLADPSIEYVSFDTETNGLDPLIPGAKITSFSVSVDGCVGYNIFCYHPELTISDGERDIIVDAAKKLLTQKKIVAQHAKHEYRYTKVCWRVTPNIVDDTMYMSYILHMSYPGISHGLKFLAGRFLGMPPWEEFIDRYVELFKRLKRSAVLTDDKIASLRDTFSDIDFTNEEAYMWHSILLDPSYYIRQEKSDESDIFMWMIPTRVLEQYAGMDAIAPLLLRKEFLKSIEADPQLLSAYRMIVKGAEVFSSIELKGVRIEDIDRWTTIYQEKLAENLAILRSYPEVIKLEEETGSEFNPGSTTQTSKLFFDHFKFPVKHLTGKGNPSTNEATLIDLIKEYRELEGEDNEHKLKFLNAYRDYKKLAKVLSAYFVGLRRFIRYNNAFDGHTCQYLSVPNGLQEMHMHPQYLLHGTETGRLSSSNPSMHVIPFRSDVKKIIVPHNYGRGGLFVSADQSQLEIRVLACIVEKFYGDPSLANAYREGRDIHKYNASKIFARPEEEIVDAERRFAKTISFSLLYGSTEHTVAENTGRTVAECKDLFESFYAAFPGVRAYIDDMHKYASTYGCVRTPFGRIRHLKAALSTDDRRAHASSMRQSQNTVIQSTGSDMSLVSIIYMDDYLKKKELSSRIVAFVHDSITLDVHPGELFEMIDLLKYSMKTLLEKLDWVTCPLGVDIDITDNMGDHCALKSMEIHEDGSRTLVLDGYDYVIDNVVKESSLSHTIMEDVLLSEEEFLEKPGDLVARKAINLSYDGHVFMEQKRSIRMRRND